MFRPRSLGPVPKVDSPGNPLIFKTIDVRVHKDVKSFRDESEERKKGAGCQTVFPFLFVHTFFSGIQPGNIVTGSIKIQVKSELKWIIWKPLKTKAQSPANTCLRSFQTMSDPGATLVP